MAVPTTPVIMPVALKNSSKCHAHADFRNDDGQAHERFIATFGRKLESPEHDRSHRANDCRDDGGYEGNGQ